MSAFVIATVSIKNPEKFQEYAEKAGPTFAPFGGKPVVKGKFVGTLSGEATHSTAAVMQFPSLDEVESWYNSDAYQALIPLRQEACDMGIVKYEMPN